MKKEDRKYYALPDGTLREIPSELTVPKSTDYDMVERDKNGHLHYWHDTPAYEKAKKEFAAALSNQPAIYTDEKYPVGLVEGEIDVSWQELIDGHRLFATRKREEANTEKHSDREGEIKKALKTIIAGVANDVRQNGFGACSVAWHYAGVWIGDHSNLVTPLLKAAQERQGEEMTVEEAYLEYRRSTLWEGISFNEYLTKHFTTIKKKQQ